MIGTIWKVRKATFRKARKTTFQKSRTLEPSLRGAQAFTTSFRFGATHRKKSLTLAWPAPSIADTPWQSRPPER